MALLAAKDIVNPIYLFHCYVLIECILTRNEFQRDNASAPNVQHSNVSSGSDTE